MILRSDYSLEYVQHALQKFIVFLFG